MNVDKSRPMSYFRRRNDVGQVVLMNSIEISFRLSDLIVIEIRAQSLICYTTIITNYYSL